MFDAGVLLGLKIHERGTFKPARTKPISALLKDPEVQKRMKEPAAVPVGIPSTIEPEIKEVRMVTLEELDLARGWTKEKTPGQREPDAGALIRMRERHHSIARLMAAGVPGVQIAEMVGLSPGMLANLQKSPAFQSLLYSYAAEFEKVAVGYKERLEAVAGAALNELHERLVEKPETFSNGVLLQTVNSLADRTGHGPTSKVVSATVALTPADIRAIKAGLVPATLEAHAEQPSGGPEGSAPRALPAVRAGEEPGDAGPERLSVSEEAWVPPSGSVPE